MIEFSKYSSIKFLFLNNFIIHEFFFNLQKFFFSSTLWNKNEKNRGFKKKNSGNIQHFMKIESKYLGPINSDVYKIQSLKQTNIHQGKQSIYIYSLDKRCILYREWTSLNINKEKETYCSWGKITIGGIYKNKGILQEEGGNWKKGGELWRGVSEGEGGGYHINVLMVVVCMWTYLKLGWLIYIRYSPLLRYYDKTNEDLSLELLYCWYRDQCLISICIVDIEINA